MGERTARESQKVTKEKGQHENEDREKNGTKAELVVLYDEEKKSSSEL